MIFASGLRPIPHFDKTSFRCASVTCRILEKTEKNQGNWGEMAMPARSTMTGLVVCYRAFAGCSKPTLIDRLTEI